MSAICAEALLQIPDLKYKAINHVFENNMVTDKGLWMEFGVFQGNSVNRIAQQTERTVYGFDSFHGLPDAWNRVEQNGCSFPKGAFSLGGSMPHVRENVQLIAGFFNDVLPNFIKTHNEPIYFMHIDSDIYSSCCDILNATICNIADGCIIVFDEMVGYNGFESNEWKAWWEFAKKYDIKFEWIGGNASGILEQRDVAKTFDHDRKLGENISPASENVALRITHNAHYAINKTGFRVAVCLSGLPRFYKEAHRNIMDTLVIPNDADVFIHTWTNSEEETNDIVNLYKPVKFLIEPQRKFINTRMNHDKMLASYARYYTQGNFTTMLYSSWYSINQSNTLKEHHRLENNFTYDCVIRARFDTVFNMPIVCSNFNMNVLNIANRDLPVPEMVDDRFAFSSNNIMNAYAAGFNMIDVIHKKRLGIDGVFCGETIVYEILKMINVPNSRVNSLLCVQNSFF